MRFIISNLPPELHPTASNEAVITPEQGATLSPRSSLFPDGDRLCFEGVDANGPLTSSGKPFKA